MSLRANSCAFCKIAGAHITAGELQRTPDGSVVAHYNCMLYSPLVISRDSQEDIEGFDFDIKSVQDEIKRGQKLRCSFCNKPGATAGCDVNSCENTYHFPCVKKAKGSPSLDKYVVYCEDHKSENGLKDVQKTKKKKRLPKNTDDRLRKNNTEKQDDNAAMQNMQADEQSEPNFMLPVHSAAELEDCEDAVPPTSGQSVSSGSGSEEESDFPDFSRWLSQKLPIKVASEQDSQNDNMTTEDAMNSVVTDTSTSADSSDTDKTPEGPPETIVRVSPSRCSSEENNVTEEQPVCSQDEEMPDKTSTSSSNGETINSTDISISVRDDTSEGCSSDCVQAAKDLGAQGTSETHPSGNSSVTEPESTFHSPREQNLNKTEVSINVGDAKTLQNAKQGQNKGIISKIVSLQQITDLSRRLVTGNFHEKLRIIVPQIQSAIDSPKRNTTENAEQSRDVDPIQTMDPVSQERSKSIALKRKLSQEVLPNMKRQPTEENAPEEEDEQNFRENELLENATTPRSAASQPASEHQSGPSSMATPLRRRLYGSLNRSNSQSGFQHERVGDPDDIDGFGRVVAGQCRRMPQDRQAKYMSYVIAAADLFCSPPTIPELDILIGNLRTVLERSQPSSPCSSRRSLV